MVNLTRIYTRTGDDGMTRLVDNQSVSKSHPRLDAYGSVDEANSALALAQSTPNLPAEFTPVLQAISNDLFDVGADIATPMADPPSANDLRITQELIDRLEGWCDQFASGLPSARSFILPAGTAGASALQFARAVVRRAERDGWRAAEHIAVNPLALRYLNRLSDLLFILARRANQLADMPESLWAPAGHPAA
ncbi:MAG: cob(I)yrinic acid a,c-diamide adenosyltransferase [Propionibacteriaceae bacterium]|jgi:cob(I)alamin adenosyltransferase|nr:cob(I)yrinic acid a,c-diamide adenosyltransferase [Propionibacteriaceae bacterium]